MIRPGTLLERIAWHASPPVHAAAGEAGLRRSILRNLGDVLNARIGHAPAQPDLGTPAPCEMIHDYPACIPRMQAAMEQAALGAQAAKDLSMSKTDERSLLTDIDGTMAA